MRESLTKWLWTASMMAVVSGAGMAAADSVAAPEVRANGQATPPKTGPTTFRATGNEPSWRLDIADGQITLLTDMGQTRTVMSAPPPIAKGGVRTYAATDRGRPVTVTIADKPCVDTMSGMPHPNTVTVAIEGKTLNGCGGDPATLLHGDWVVESLAGAPVVKDSKLTMTFATDGRLTGNASCNRFMSGFELTGESLKIAQPAASMMMCTPDEVMKQEGTFLKLLGAVATFSVAGDVLTLSAADGRAIKARRAPAQKV